MTTLCGTIHAAGRTVTPLPEHRGCWTCRGMRRRRIGCDLGGEMGLFQSIRCTREFQSDARAEAHPMEARTSIGWKFALQSDAPPRFNPLRFRVSIRCAFAFQSIETFFDFLTWIWRQRRSRRQCLSESREFPRDLYRKA